MHCSVFSQVEGVMHSLYPPREVRYTIFRATKTRDIPIYVWALGAQGHARLPDA